MRRVLVVEDDAWLGGHFVRIIHDAGMHATLTTNALDAIEAIDHSAPNVVLLDMRLPGVNGITFLHEVASHADLAKIPIVVCSTLVLSLEELRPYGVCAVLDKATVVPEELIHVLQPKASNATKY